MFYQTAKRIIDILGSILGLLLLAPFIPFIAMAIALNSRGPIFVALPRVSKGKTIKLYKFRSMVKNAHALKPTLLKMNERSDGPFFKMRHDPRLTRVGKVLRRFRIDEFPQLWNVFKGDLSLVGPRPHEPEEVTRYPEPYTHLIHETSGITGLSQIKGASSLPFLKELELDHYYITHASLILDLKILGKTIAIFLFDHTAV